MKKSQRWSEKKNFVAKSEMCLSAVLFFPLLSDEPYPPRAPEVVDQDRDHIKIKWEPPENDGGSPITGYEVERKEPKGNRWTKVLTLSQTANFRLFQT